MTEHAITQEEDRSWRRYVCKVCDWATEWVQPGNATAGAAAVRHSGGMPEPRAREEPQ